MKIKKVLKSLGSAARDLEPLVNVASKAYPLAKLLYELYKNVAHH